MKVATYHYTNALLLLTSRFLQHAYPGQGGSLDSVAQYVKIYLSEPHPMVYTSAHSVHRNPQRYLLVLLSHNFSTPPQKMICESSSEAPHLSPTCPIVTSGVSLVSLYRPIIPLTPFSSPCHCWSSHHRSHNENTHDLCCCCLRDMCHKCNRVRSTMTQR